MLIGTASQRSSESSGAQTLDPAGRKHNGLGEQLGTDRRAQ